MRQNNYMTAVSWLSLLDTAVVLGQPEADFSSGLSANALTFYKLNMGFWHSHILKFFPEKSNF